MTSKNIGGKPAAQALDLAGMVVNYNAVPFDPRKPSSPSGIRLGTAAVTSRGFRKKEMVQVGEWINAVISEPENHHLIAEIAGAYRFLLQGFSSSRYDCLRRLLTVLSLWQWGSLSSLLIITKASAARSFLVNSFSSAARAA